MTQPIIIIGAGAAGLAAGRTLHDLGHPVIILEARDRIGGRTWTHYDLAPYPVELGAEYIHGTSVLTWDFIRRYGLGTLRDVGDHNIFVALQGEIAPYDHKITEDWDEIIWEAAEAWIEAGKSDVSLRTLLDEHDLLSDHNAEEARLINNAFAADYGGDLDELGTAAFIEATFDGDGTEKGDFRLKTGYTALMQQLAEGLDVRLNTAVAHIGYSADRVQVTTADGATHRAAHAIVTLPLGVLKAGDVQFDPPLPAPKQHAVEGLGVGHVNKIVLVFDEPFWQDDLGLLYTALDSQLWWRPGWGRWDGNLVSRWLGWHKRDEKPLLTAFAGGRAGARHSALSADEAISHSLANLAKVFGQDVTRMFASGLFVNWGADPHSKMGYSFGSVGSAGMRSALAAPLHNTVYFAGEACNPIRPQTVHGAMETGIQAARRIDAISQGARTPS